MTKWYLDGERLPHFGLEAYKNSGSLTTIYVSADGYDDTGDGSIGSPYRQIQRALDDIPSHAKGSFLIQLGPGDYEPFIFDRPLITENLTQTEVFIVGDRSNPAMTFGSSPTFSKVDGYNGRYTANIGAYAYEVNESTHWIEGTSDFWPLDARVILDSASPNLDVLDNGGFTGGTLTNLHPYSSRIVASGFGMIGSTVDVGPTFGGLFLSGVDIDIGPSSFLKNIYFKACKVSQSSVSNTVYAERCRGDFVCEGKLVSFGGNHVGLITKGQLDAEGPLLVNVGAFKGDGVSIDIKTGFGYGAKNAVRLSGCDFYGGGTAIDASSVEVALVGDIYIIGNGYSTFLQMANNSSLAGSATIVGSTSDVCVKLSSGSQAEGLSTMCDGTLTNSSTPGDEIQVGDGAPANKFSDLPITDATTLCRAT